MMKSYDIKIVLLLFLVVLLLVLNLYTLSRISSKQINTEHNNSCNFAVSSKERKLFVSTVDKYPTIANNITRKHAYSNSILANYFNYSTETIYIDTSLFAGEHQVKVGNCIFNSYNKDHETHYKFDYRGENVDYTENTFFYTTESAAWFHYDCKLCNEPLKFGFNEFSTAQSSYAAQNLYDGVFDYNDNKINKILVIISNCKEDRLEYIKNILPDEYFDYCGKCGLNNEVSCLGNGHEWFQIESMQLLNSYKYYLAFENTLCQNYASEKFYKTLYANTIPVIFDVDLLPDYLKVFPVISTKNHTKQSLKKLLDHYNDINYKVDYTEYEEYLIHLRYEYDNHKTICEHLNLYRFDEQYRNNLLEKTKRDYKRCLTACKNTFGCIKYPTIN